MSFLGNVFTFVIINYNYLSFEYVRVYFKIKCLLLLLPLLLFYPKQLVLQTFSTYCNLYVQLQFLPHHAFLLPSLFSIDKLLVHRPTQKSQVRCEKQRICFQRKSYTLFQAKSQIVRIVHRIPKRPCRIRPCSVGSRWS